MSNLIKNVSPEDKKMLNRIFLRSFTVFASGAGGSVKAGEASHDLVQHHPERRHVRHGPRRLHGEGELRAR